MNINDKFAQNFAMAVLRVLFNNFSFKNEELSYLIVPCFGAISNNRYLVCSDKNTRN